MMITRRSGLKMAFGMGAAVCAAPITALADSSISILGGAGDLLGEGPLWSADTGRIFWVNIAAQKIYALNLKTKALQTWDAPKPVCYLAERKSGGMIAGLSDGVYAFDEKSSAFNLLVKPEDRTDTRLNDGKVDAKGRLWTGTMHLPWSEKVGAFYRVDTDLKATKVDGPYLCTNGPTFSPDLKRLWHVESFDKVVYVFDVAEDGTLSNKQVFVDFKAFEADGWGGPDGMATDVKGGVWIAHYGGGRISRFFPDGKLDFQIKLPASQITSLTFGGDKLDHLYVSSAAQFLPEGASDKAVAGALFEVPPPLLRGHIGLPTNKFGG
jgi:sugar lactone lactonase YvrE